MPSTDIYYLPYEHQYQCWKTLLKDKSPDGKPMSIVVTTGTGSGKTECFMLPLVQDLIDHHASEQVQAIFLYPLNALMEDQKARMENYWRERTLLLPCTMVICQNICLTRTTKTLKNT